MSFKIPKSILYLAIGINVSLLFFGVAIEESQLAILAILNITLCSFPIFTEKEDEE